MKNKSKKFISIALIILLLVGLGLYKFIDSIGVSKALNLSKIQQLSLMKNSPDTQTTFVINENNILYGYGDNKHGQLGCGTTKDKSIPIKISLENDITITQIVSSFSHSIAIGSDGELYTWGYNKYGELGDGTTIEKDIPIRITLVSGVKPKQISCSAYFSMAIGDDGNLYTWGRNNLGQLGDGTIIDKSTPTKIILANEVNPTQIACGFDFSMAIGSNSELYVWGINDKGQLGDGTTLNKSTPIEISLGDQVKPTQITAGGSHAMAIGSNKELYTWGDNTYGQLGDGSPHNVTKIGIQYTWGSDRNKIYKYTPEKITLANWGVKPTQIACGNEHSMAIGSDGELYTWGSNGSSQLGNGFNEVTENKPIEITPQRIKLKGRVKPTQIACGYFHSMAIGSDGELYTWGLDNSIQPTFTHTANKSEPMEIDFDFN